MPFIFHTDGRVEATTLTHAIEWDQYRRTKGEDRVSVGSPSTFGEESSSLSEEQRWRRAMESLEAGDRALLAEFLKEAPIRSTPLKALIRKHKKGPAHYFNRIVKVAEAEGFSADDVYTYEPTKKMSTYSAGRLLRLYGA